MLNTPVETLPSVVFVCQAGELEVKAVLLAASLRHFNPQLELVAAVPTESLWGVLKPHTRTLLATLNVRLMPIESPFGQDYLIGNKIAAMALPVSGAQVLFLDSDILCLQSISSEFAGPPALRAKPADGANWGSPEAWRAAYGSVQAPVPAWRVQALVGGDVMMPYFNAGVVAVPNNQRFAECWLDTARVIDASDAVTEKRPWLDQIALPVAAARLELPCVALTKACNYPAHILPRGSHEATLCHYHWPKVIAQEPRLLACLGALVGRWPSLRALFEFDSAWQHLPSLIDRMTPPPANGGGGSFDGDAGKAANMQAAAGDFVVTGLPRSGTSLLCNLLHQAADVVVLNEPPEVFSALASASPSEAFGAFYRDQRAAIFRGEEIDNKVDAVGRVIEDTRLADERRRYRPLVNPRTFSLGSKNPLAYLARLRWLCEHYPEMPKVALIRHPYGTVSSWVKSFEHLAEVDLAKIPFTDLADLRLDEFQCASLRRLAGDEPAPVRRALLWNYLSELLWRERARVLVVRFEDLLADPAAVMLKITAYLKVAEVPLAALQRVRPAEGFGQQGALAPEQQADLQAINGLCVESMARWGYEVGGGW